MSVIIKILPLWQRGWGTHLNEYRQLDPSRFFEDLIKGHIEFKAGLLGDFSIASHGQ